MADDFDLLGGGGGPPTDVSSLDPFGGGMGGEVEHVEEVTVEGDAEVLGDEGHVEVHEEIYESPSPTRALEPLSPMMQFHVQHEAYLLEKARKSEEKHSAIRDKASADTDNFYKERGLKRDKSCSRNRESESEFMKHRDATAAAADSWDSIGSLVDLQAKPVGKDTSRMKQVLVQLKH